MLAQFANIAVVMVLFRLISYFDLAKEENLVYIRSAYGISVGIQLLILFFIRSRVIAQNDQTVFKYMEAKKPFEEKEPEVIETTIKDYDVQQVMAQVQQMLVSLVIIAFIHLQWGYIPPLIMQSVLSFKNLVGVPLVKVHLLGAAATGELARPWKAKTMFDNGPQTLGPKELKQKERKEAKKRAVGKAE